MHNHSAESGYLLLADISGFSAYMADVELDHAHGVLQELRSVITGSLTPPMQVATVEGDAVLAYAPAAEVVRGEAVLELVEATYVSFRDQVAAIHRSTTCGCQACLAIPTLDLKFFVHFGEYIRYPTPAGDELDGLDARLLRQRMLKDQVNEANGTGAYALFTAQSLAKMDVQPEGMTTNSGTYEHIGEVETAWLDLRPRYDALTDARAAYVTAEEAEVILTHDFDVSPSILWDWLNDPHKRTQWQRMRSWTVQLRPGGRTGAGAVNHCAHGIGYTLETVLDWRPFVYYTVRAKQNPVGMDAIQTYEFEALPNGGTRLRVNMKANDSQGGWFGRAVIKFAGAAVWPRDYQMLDAMIKETEPAPQAG